MLCAHHFAVEFCLGGAKELNRFFSTHTFPPVAMASSSSSFQAL
jgi:hypothetical protein